MMDPQVCGLEVDLDNFGYEVVRKGSEEFDLLIPFRPPCPACYLLLLLL